MDIIEMNKIASTILDGIEDLKLKHVELPGLGPYEVRIRVVASALNFFDLLILIGKYQHKPELPFIPGSEGAGVICQVGSAVSRWKVDDPVMFLTLSGGALSSHVVIDTQIPHVIFAKPPAFSFQEAAGFPVGFLTGYHGLVQRGALSAGDHVLVTGAAGGMSVAAIQLAKRLGAVVIAAASSAEKLEVARQAGADFLVDYSTEDLKARVEEVTGGRMVDVCYEVVGGKVFKECVRCMASNGRLLVVGFASGEIPVLPANLVLVKGFQVVGVRSGAEMMLHPEKATELWEQMVTLTQNRDLVPPCQEWPVHTFPSAFKSIYQRTIKGKAIINWSRSKIIHSKL